MNIRVLFLTLGLFSLVGCTPSPATATYSEASSSNSPPPTSTLYPTAASLPTAIFTPTSPSDHEVLQSTFSAEILFTTTPDTSKAQRVFPAGTQQIFAIWEYTNMREGLTIRREWYRDHELWLLREEPWDFERYGSEGLVMDISVYDFDQGLEAGIYQLYLSIDDQPQFVSELGYVNAFRIVEPWPIEPIASPDGSQLAFVKKPGTLIIQETNGQQRELVTTDEISSMAWLPHKSAIVFSDRDRSQQIVVAGTMGRRDELWVIQTETGAMHPIGDAEENLHTPHVSPDGRFIALLSGTGFGDALFIDLSLIIMELDQELQRTAVYQLSDFEGFPENVTIEDLTDYVLPVSFEDSERPGRWLNDTQLLVGLEWLGVGPLDEITGIYKLDLNTMNAERMGDLYEASQGLQ